MGRKKKDESAPPGIVVLYTSLMLLLLSFFILLNAISTVEEGKLSSAYTSLSSAFGFTPGGLSPLATSTLKESATGVVPFNPVDRDFLSLRGLVTGADQQQIKLLRSATSRTVVLPTDLLFEVDSLELSEEGKAFLVEVAGIIAESQYPLTIRGHTDDTQSFLPGRDNFYVSSMRALNVLRFLAINGVDPKRMAAFGLAGNQPMYPNISAVYRQQNNRVELVMQAEDPARYAISDPDRDRLFGFRGFIFNLFRDVDPDRQQTGDKTGGQGEGQ